jgi:hypothetical protein
VQLTKQTLTNPATASQKDFNTFMNAAVKKTTNKELFDGPTDAEIAAFVVKYQEKDYHSGNTGFYYDFGTKKQDFILTGLHGCTAAVIVVSITCIFEGLPLSNESRRTPEESGDSTFGSRSQH